MVEDALRNLLAEITTRLNVEGDDATAEAAARRQELREAVTSLGEGIDTRSRDKITSACKRLERLVRFKSAADQRWLATTLDRFRAAEIGSSDTVDATSRHAPGEMTDVLVVAALFEPELEQLISRLPSLEEKVGRGESFLAGRTYYKGVLRSRSRKGGAIKVIALFQDRMGMVECAALVSNAVAAWQPRLVAMTGVCAGRAEAGVKLNDIIVPSAVFTYDTGKRTTAGFLREPLWCETSLGVIQRVRVRGNAVLREMAAEIQQAFPGNVAMPTIHTDVMACGSSVIDLPGAITKIAGVHRKVVALDMESYALLRATQMTGRKVQSLVVKGVMDLSHDKTDGVKSQAAAWAAAFLTRFIESEFDAVCETDSRGAA